jgi:transcriptional regulator with XRE-family HTH domain
MRAKLDEKERAIALRKQGWAVRKIADELVVSRGSVSLWVRGIQLTKTQRRQLAPRSPLRMEIYQGMADRKRIQAEEIRKGYQTVGRVLAKAAGSNLYLAGCMLYWGEGSKNRTTLTVTNSDPDMVRFFMRFLREACGVSENKITLKVAAYLDNNLQREDIEKYWLNVTGLPATQIRKGTTKQCLDSRKHKLPYGTVAVSVHSVELVQKVYGSICEFASIDGNRWL